MMARSSFIYSTFQGITKIADLTACSNLTVLYLYNNKLKSIEALDSAPNIQLLYLQNNKISRMGGLEKLKKLKKLYLTRNKIQVLEGLLENRCLEVFFNQNEEWRVSNVLFFQELHVDRQLLRPGEHFVMDPRNCLALASCLKVLHLIILLRIKQLSLSSRSSTSPGQMSMTSPGWSSWLASSASPQPPITWAASRLCWRSCPAWGCSTA